MATMAEGGTTADRAGWERKYLDLLIHWLDNEPATQEVAVAEMMIVNRDFAPWDMIEASKTDRRAFVALMFVVRRLKENDGLALLASPLLDWAVDVADGTLKPPRARRGRPPKGSPANREYLIGAIVDEIAAIGLRPASSNKHWDRTSPLSSAPSACHMVAAKLFLAPNSVRNIWNRYRRERGK